MSLFVGIPLCLFHAQNESILFADVGYFVLLVVGVL